MQHVLDATLRHLGRHGNEQLTGRVQTLRTDLARLAQHRSHFASLVPSPTLIETQCRILADAARTRQRCSDQHLATRTTRGLADVTGATVLGIDHALCNGQLLQLAGLGDPHQAGPRLTWVSQLGSGSEEREALQSDAKAVRRSAEKLAAEATAAVGKPVDPSRHLTTLRCVDVTRGPTRRTAQVLHAWLPTGLS